jgi:lipid-binding SYLF domain-containing protein/outer membrane protein OmpA-like peptidoglycan-associated protein
MKGYEGKFLHPHLGDCCLESKYLSSPGRAGGATMMWRKSLRLALFMFLWLPAASYGQTAGGGSGTVSNPLNVYAPPCISQVKQYIAASCQITPTGGAQPYSYAYTGDFPSGMSMSTGSGGGLINGTPTETTSVPATVKVTDARGGSATTSFIITPAGLTGAGSCGSSVCVTGDGYAIKTAEGYTITTLATVQMTATTYWSDGSTLDATSMATWACAPTPQCGSVSANGLYTAGSSVGTYRVTATLSGVTNNGGSGVAVTVATVQANTKESDRVANSGMVMREVLQLRSGIPEAVLQKAECVIVIPSTLKFAAGVGGSYGRGVMTCRGGLDFQGPWGAPSMIALGGGSFGLQVGGQATDFVLLLMNDRAANSILTSKVKIGATASAAGGPVGRESTAATDIFLRAEILSYSRARGLFAGVSLEGSTLRPDNRANRKLYGKEVNAKAIVLKGEVSPPPSALELLSVLNSKSPNNRSAGRAPPPPPPNRPPVASCSANPTHVVDGSQGPVLVRADASDPGNGRLTYKWTTTGGVIEGTGSQVRWNPAGVAPGMHTVSAQVDDGNGGYASCVAEVRVDPRPNRPPMISCSANPRSVQPGGRVRITGVATDPDNDPLTFSWETTGGQVVGSGSEVDVDTTHLEPSHYTVTGHVSDGRGGTAVCHAEIILEAPAVEARLFIRSIYFPTALPSAKAPDRGLEESQQVTLTSLASDFKEYLESKPDAHLELQGHADRRGTPEYNEGLSERRVEITKRFLVGLGIPETNLSTKAYGEEDNLTPEQVKQLVEQHPNLSEEQKDKILKNLKLVTLAQNRRVDITLSGTRQHSVRQFPFNAEDALTLLSAKTTK